MRGNELKKKTDRWRERAAVPVLPGTDDRGPTSQKVGSEPQTKNNTIGHFLFKNIMTKNNLSFNTNCISKSELISLRIIFSCMLL